MIFKQVPKGKYITNTTGQFVHGLPGRRLNVGRLTTDKSVEDMGMYEMAHNCCYGKEGSARYRDYVKDIDARQFTRDIYYSYIGQKLPENEDEFDECMLDMLMYDTAEIEGLIACFYRNLWAMADLRERLKEYEDIIDEPEKLKIISKVER